MWLRWNSSIYNAPLLGNWNISTSVWCSNYKCKYCLTTWREVYLNWLSVEKKTHQLLYMCADFGLTYSRYSPSKYCKCCKYRNFFSIMTKQFWIFFFYKRYRHQAWTLYCRYFWVVVFKDFFNQSPKSAEKIARVLSYPRPRTPTSNIFIINK